MVVRVLFIYFRLKTFLKFFYSKLKVSEMYTYTIQYTILFSLFRVENDKLTLTRYICVLLTLLK